MGVNMTKILLVEDDKSLREIYGVRLMAEGYQIVSADDGEDGLSKAVKERPDLIISDIMMPKISGFDMLDILRSTPETKDIKIIMMTALSSEDQRSRGVSLGANRYLVKSQVGIEDVVRTVHDVLGDAPATNNIPGGPSPFTMPIAVPTTSNAVPITRQTVPTTNSAASSTPPIAQQQAPITQPTTQTSTPVAPRVEVISETPNKVASTPPTVTPIPINSNPNPTAEPTKPTNVPIAPSSFDISAKMAQELKSSNPPTVTPPAAQ